VAELDSSLAPHHPDARIAGQTSPVIQPRGFRTPAGRARNGSNAIQVDMTAEQLELLTTLAADQLFRREFIDPKMPGYRGNAEEVLMGKALVARFRALLEAAGRRRTAAAGMRA
jgi:hypothetical protein